MSGEVTDPQFWRTRLLQAHASGRGLHTAIYDVDPETWDSIQCETRGRVLNAVLPGRRILDIGCGYGAVYDCLPNNFKTGYVGIDVSPELVEIAKLRHPEGNFVVADATRLPFSSGHFDLAVIRSIRAMLMRAGLPRVFASILREARRVASGVLVLEYGRDVGRNEPVYVDNHPEHLLENYL